MAEVMAAPDAVIGDIGQAHDYLHKHALAPSIATTSVIIYPGVGHALANPSGGTYDARAADEAWRETVSFPKGNLSTD